MAKVDVDIDAVSEIAQDLASNYNKYMAELVQFKKAGDALGYTWASGPDCSVKLSELSTIYNSFVKYAENFLTISNNIQSVSDKYNSTDGTNF